MRDNGAETRMSFLKDRKHNLWNSVLVGVEEDIDSSQRNIQTPNLTFR